MKTSVEKAYNQAKIHFPLSPDVAKVADYIPELSKANPQHLAVSVTDISGTTTSLGDKDAAFTIQSIGKLINLAVALEEQGADYVFQRVGKEASGDPFNSILRLETGGDGIPSNPMINAGAIAVCSCIQGENPTTRFEKITSMAQKLLGKSTVTLDEQVYRSESATGHRNRSLAYMMMAYNVFQEDFKRDKDIDPLVYVEELLEVYFKSCSLLVTAQDLSHLGAVLANDGTAVDGSNTPLLSKSTARTIRALMSVAGLYDGSGEFAVTMGFPAKSGVGGGIVGVVPGRMGIGVFSPALDHKGNSYGGLQMLETLSKELDLFVY